MKRLIFSVVLTLASCGYDGGYRYECQDPNNWNSDECKPPICEAAGYCTKDLIGFDPTEPKTP